jgi:hypothetical protein
MDFGQIDIDRLQKHPDCKLDKDKLYYLASPYTHKDQEVMNERFEKVNYFATYLLKQYGINCIEPICTGHVKVQYDLPIDFEFWSTRDKMFIDHCRGLIVYCLPGWETSKGVTSEIEYAKKCYKPVYYIKELSQ